MRTLRRCAAGIVGLLAVFGTVGLTTGVAGASSPTQTVYISVCTTNSCLTPTPIAVPIPLASPSIPATANQILQAVCSAKLPLIGNATLFVDVCEASFAGDTFTQAIANVPSLQGLFLNTRLLTSPPSCSSLYLDALLLTTGHHTNVDVWMPSNCTT